MEAGDDKVAAVDIEPGRDRVGAMLRARRLELNLSQADVAHMVKLPARRIDAMEHERWGELPDGPYLRGFLRNVARALNLDAADLVQRVDASLGLRDPEAILTPQGVTHVTLPRRNGPADDRRGGTALVVGAFLSAIVAALIAWSGTDSFDRSIAAVARVFDPSRKTADDVVRPPPTIPATPTADQDAPSKAPDVVVANAGGTTSPPSAATPASVSPTSPLSFHFNEDSWVEVRSADGRVLLQKLNAAGSEQQLDGEAPFSLVVGNAKGVALQFRGQPVDLAPYTRDSVARFTLS